MRGATPADVWRHPDGSDFNPRAPYGARPWPALRGSALTNFNPRAPCGARPTITGYNVWYTEISIHAPHTGRDISKGMADRLTKGFQSTRPIRGATFITKMSILGLLEFQSTRPIRGATPQLQERYQEPKDFNPRAPYGARPLSLAIMFGSRRFQSTRPIRGATELGQRNLWVLYDFNPRAPYGARRRRATFELDGVRISIHAPHTGRDAVGWKIILWSCNFNPRAPYGARLNHPLAFLVMLPAFQSTRPIRGATSGNNRLKLGEQNFNPRAPYGARQIPDQDGQQQAFISIHAPHTGRDTLARTSAAT